MKGIGETQRLPEEEGHRANVILTSGVVSTNPKYKTYRLGTLDVVCAKPIDLAI